MAIKSTTELLESIRAKIGESTDDETLGLYEDLSDTFNDIESKINNNNEDWKSKYEQNDAEWRQKYRDRFFNSGDGNEPEPYQEPDPEPKRITRFEDLFKFE